MKKNLIFIISILLFASCEQKKSSSKSNTDLVQQNLKGSVQQTTETTYKVDSSGNMGEMDSCCVITNNLNDSGYQTSSSSKDSKGTIKTEETITHYPNGMAKEIINTKEGKPDSRITIDIDDKGNYKSAKSFDSTGKEDSYYIDLSQNDYGELTGGKQYKTDSTLKYSFESTFDDSAHFTAGHTDSAGKKMYATTVTLNDKGDPVKYLNTRMVKDSTVHDTTTYRYDKYDDMDNWTQRTTLNSDGKPKEITKREIIYFKKQD